MKINKLLENADNDFGKDVNKNIGNIGDNIGDYIVINNTQKQILEAMKINPKISAAAISKDVGVALRNVEVNIQKLKMIGLIKRVGPAFGGHWIEKMGG